MIRTRAPEAPLPVLAVVFALEMKGVLLDLGVAEGLQYPAPVGAQEVVGHVRVEVEIVCVIQKVSVIKIIDFFSYYVSFGFTCLDLTEKTSRKITYRSKWQFFANMSFDMIFTKPDFEPKFNALVTFSLQPV
jgi:hypothetical protein